MENCGLIIEHVMAGLQQKSGGPSYCVPALASALTTHGRHVGLHVLGPAKCEYPHVDLCAYPEWSCARRLGYSPQMYKALKQAAKRADILHNNGLWMLPNLYAASAVRGTSCRLVNSLHGTLSPQALARSRWKKQFMWHLRQGRALQQTDCLHATSSKELRDIRNCGLKAPVAVVPNGIDVPPRIVTTKSSPRRLLFLGRIHPIKGIDYLLQAWRQLQRKSEEWELHIVGGGERRHVAAAERLTKRLQVERVFFHGPVYGNAKTIVFQQADLFVLPSRSENFGIAVAESLAHGVPAIVSHGAPWAGLTDHACGWWIETGVAPLYECLQHVLQLSRPTLVAMGQRGRDWMSREFSWSRIADMMYQTYCWLLGGGTPPDWVEMNATTPSISWRRAYPSRAA